MKYRTFPRSEEKLSILGFGCMRLPQNSDSYKDINWQLSKQMIRSAIDRGVNYIDTAYPYHGGQSEPLVADALQDGYRQKVQLATKLPTWLIKSREDMDRYLNEQLEKLQTDYIDYYLIHTLTKGFWKKLTEHDVFDFMDKAVADGRVRNIGFSFHDDYETFTEIVDSYDWDFCQIQYNYLDVDEQAGEKGLAYAYDRGLGVIVMEPLRGGSLTAAVPEEVQALWERAPIQRSPAEWALRWVWNDPRVSVVLSGMSSQQQVDENIAVAQTAEAEALSDEELRLIEQVRQVYRSKIEVPCTSCGYCMPCPHGVDIPEAFRYYNEALMFADVDSYRNEYQQNKKNHLATLCVACGECEPKCPQHIEIISSLEKVSKVLC
ncbi:MAG: aldo/keto reductase [Spirochaetota bacterium]